jgi:hypothetical protein
MRYFEARMRGTTAIVLQQLRRAKRNQ